MYWTFNDEITFSYQDNISANNLKSFCSDDKLRINIKGSEYNLRNKMPHIFIGNEPEFKTLKDRDGNWIAGIQERMLEVDID